MRVSDLEGRHPGETIWVLGSGPSLGFIDSGFFDGKLTIGVNRVAIDYAPTTYSVTKYHELAEDLIVASRSGSPSVVVSRHQHGNLSKAVFDDQRRDCWVFEHNDNPADDLRRWQWPEDGQLISSHSSIGSALHLAAHLGARYCVVVGHDCGEIDAAQHIAEYPRAAADAMWVQYPSFERQSTIIKSELKRRYGMDVHSLNPFINLNLEGHSFYSKTNRINLPFFAAVRAGVRSYSCAVPNRTRAARRIVVRLRDQLSLSRSGRMRSGS